MYMNMDLVPLPAPAPLPVAAPVVPSAPPVATTANGQADYSFPCSLSHQVSRRS